MKEKLRIGFFTDDLTVPAWIYELTRRLMDAHYARIVFVTRRISTGSLNGHSRNGKLAGTLYSTIEKRVFRLSDDPFQLQSLTDLLHEIPVVEVPVREKDGFDHIDEHVRRQLSDYHPDVCVKFGFKRFTPDLLSIAGSGIWEYYHGDSNSFRGGPPGIWEVFSDTVQTGCELRMLHHEHERGTILVNSWSSTKKTINRNLYHYYWKSVEFLPRKLNELYERGADQFHQELRGPGTPLEFYSKPEYSRPGHHHYILLLCKHMVRQFRLSYTKLLYRHQWILLYALNTSGEGIVFSLPRYRRLLPPADRFWADPFIIYKKGLYYLFVEEYIYSRKKGHIAVMTIDSNGVVSPARAVLERPYHLSYPFTFEAGGEIFMVPETSGNKAIELYRCIDFPFEWKLEKTLLKDVNAADTTILYYNNRYWLFTLIAPSKGPVTRDELYIFHSDDLLSDSWKPHPKNPVISDVKRARSAGRIFNYGGKLFRPSQDCSLRYGYRILFNEILVLSESEYQEREVTSIAPEWKKDLLATHTFAHEKNLSVVDALIRRRRLG